MSGATKKFSGSVFAAMIQAGTLMAAGDVISQTVMEKKKLENIDPVRVARFGFIGAIFIGPTLRIWYNFLERSVPGVGLKAAAGKMLLDQLVGAPPFYLAFMGILGVTKNQSFEQIKTSVKDEYKDIMIANYKLWPPVQLLNFWMVPLHHRVLFEQSVAVFWNTYLAWKTNRFDTPTEAEVVENLEKMQMKVSPPKNPFAKIIRKN